MICTEYFDTLRDGTPVLQFVLTDGNSTARILNYGATIQSLVVADKHGKPVDVVLGYRTVAEYEQNDGYLGAIIGRFGNRIDRGRLCIDGREYALYCNNNGHHLHGGRVGFDKKIWSHSIEGDALTLSLLSPDGEENYPGNLQVRVTYTLQDKELKIRYYALSDRRTAINLTNHAYFNLNGGRGSIKAHELWLDSDYITPTDENMIPRGAFREVRNTPFDFNTSKKIGKHIHAKDIDIQRGSGYDHCYLLKNTVGEYGKYAVVKSRKTGICMTCYTDMPAVQLYTGNYLSQRGKEGYYKKHAGFCLETQAIPNNVNVPAYAAKGSSIYEAGREYIFTAAYRFSAIEEE